MSQATRVRPVLGRRTTTYAVAAVLVLALLWWFAPWHTANQITLSGQAYANSDATAIGFEADSPTRALRWGLSRTGEGFVVAGAAWTGTDGTTHHADEPPACLVPGATTHIELSFVRVRYLPGEGGPTRVVTGLRCLE